MAIQKRQSSQKHRNELDAAALASHEEICAVRYENIEKRLDSGQQRFIRIEAQIWGLYALLIGGTILGQFAGG